jgi:DNA polymerase-3 subunit delta'
MAHLYLLEGPKGSGKLTLSFLVSAELLKRKGEDQERLLAQIKKLNHPNVILIQPDGNSIKKEQILNLQNEFSKTSLYAGARIYIIEDIEKITQAGANSLLKFLEEPEGKTTYGFLLTENLSQVLDTIQSRSQIIHLVGIHKQDIKQALVQKDASPLISEILPEITNSIEDAVGLINYQPVLEIEEFLKRLSQEWLNKDIYFQLDYVDLVNETKSSLDWYKSFLNLVLLFFTDLIRYKVHRTITFESLRSDIQKISVKLSLTDLEEITSKIKKHINRLRVPVNINMYYQMLLIELDKERNK